MARINLSDMEGINENSSDEEDLNMSSEFDYPLISASSDSYILDCL